MHTRRILTGSILPTLACLLAAPTEGGGAPPPQSIEERLTAALAKVAAVEKERDDFQSKLGPLEKERDDTQKLKSQFEELSKAANDTKSELTTAKSEVTRLTAELKTAANDLTLASANVSRLESLCGVKGIDPKKAVTTSAAPAAPGNEHVFDQWIKAEGSAKTQLWRDHKAEIRAEATRRGQPDAA